MRKNKTEVLFRSEAKIAGLTLLSPRPIRTNNPVKNKHGRRVKVVTVPDFYVIDPQTGNGCHVEITNGSGDNPHKTAQRRVVAEAGITNYIVLTGNQVLEIHEQATPSDKNTLIKKLLNFI